MPVESATYISDLDPSYPSSTDGMVEADNHMRLIKVTLKNTFPSLIAPVTSTAAHLNSPLIRTTPTANTVPYFTSTSAAANAAVGSVGLAVLGAATAVAARDAMSLDSRYVQGTGGAITGNASISGTLAVTGATTFSSTLSSASTTTGALTIQSTAPQLVFQDTDNRSAMIHVNSNVFYIMRGGVNGTTFDSGPNGRYPLTINMDSGDVVASGNVWAYSDERLKTDITLISNALDKVKSLRGVTFARKEEGTIHTGVIAQDVQAVLPEAVLTDSDGYLSVAYGNLVGLLIEAIKELAVEVAALKAAR